MTSRWFCYSCRSWHEAWVEVCPCQIEDPEPEEEPETEQDRIDAAGDDLFHSMREDGEL